MKKYKVNDTVRLLSYPENDMNSHARVVKVTMKGVVVTNMNMPFQGTLSRVFFHNHEVD